MQCRSQEFAGDGAVLGLYVRAIIGFCSISVPTPYAFKYLINIMDVPSHTNYAQTSGTGTYPRQNIHSHTVPHNKHTLCTFSQTPNTESDSYKSQTHRNSQKVITTNAKNHKNAKNLHSYHVNTAKQLVIQIVSIIKVKCDDIVVKTSAETHRCQVTA